MKKLFVSVILTLAATSAFAGNCELSCAADQLACARSASNNAQQGMCRFAYNLCVRNCGGSSFQNQNFQQLLEKTTLEIQTGHEQTTVEYF